MDEFAVELGNTGITSTRIGLGTAGFRDGVTQDEIVEVVRTAIDCGIKHIDTAALYQTEEKVGTALRELTPPNDIVVATKVCGYRDWERGINYWSFERDSILQSIELSLKRLQVSKLEIVHLHDVHPEHMPQVFKSGGALDTLVSLQEQGVIQQIGMATMHMGPLLAAADDPRIGVVQTYNVYDLLNGEAADQLFPTAKSKGKGIINTAPFAGFILTTGPVPEATYNYRPVPERIRERVVNMQARCAEKGVKLADAALSFCLENSLVDSTVLASSNPARVRGWIDALENPVPHETVQDILEAGK